MPRFPLLGLALAIALGASTLAAYRASAGAMLSAAPNPVTVASGTTSGATTITWDAGTAHLAQIIQDPGAVQIVSDGTPTGSVAATVYCGKTNSFTLKDANFGTTLATVTVNVNGCGGSTGGVINLGGSNLCALLLSGCSGSPMTPGKPVPPAPLTLKPSNLVSSMHLNDDCNCGVNTTVIFPFGYDAWSCDYTPIQSPIDVFSLSGVVATGFAHHNDPGSGPMPCWAWDDEFYRGGVTFPMDTAHSYVFDHGLVSAKLSFTLNSGNMSCLSRIGIDTSDWSKWSSVPAVLPASQAAIPPPVALGNQKFSLDLTSYYDYSWKTPINFVFIGTDEGTPQENNTCTAEFSDFALTITGSH